MPTTLPKPYLLFLGDETEVGNVKTSSGIAFWRSEQCVGQISLDGGTVDLGLPQVTIAQAKEAGAKTLVIGIANFGGRVSENWMPVLKDALRSGLNIAAGLHTQLNNVPELVELAENYNRKLFDIRQPEQQFNVGKGNKRTGKRLLSVGTDCSVGKMYTSLSIEKELVARGYNADFRATGQTGIFITGEGVCVDAVVSDFIAGATEVLSPDNETNHWDVIEGQGSLFHPAYAGVTLGLLHGSQPDALVLCHDASRETIEDYPDFPIPEFGDCMDFYIAAAKLTNPNVYFVGMSINTSKLDEDSAIKYLKSLEQKYALPCCDPVRTGVSGIVDRMIELT
ncbi:N-acetyltransferase DgcN [Paremcibacter congregatus]|uniref:EBNA-1 nuclear protein n=1 Tax=Paremcibacter congregatus TaxID=2043170 RepID=A0A2G4YVK2_9PROT|nr:N-acetyltransferase DgcN [Paremcibacter congregatus]PHZ86382.1 EBNA-1 nuclear protein [Paremcibacter congregatus]QDE28521.1 DUF1611 domain-containing protein [Paremcibacter congregatus]